MVCDVDGNVIPDLIVSGANQEHSILSLREGSSDSLPELPVGTKLRILPNHACATAAQHEAYWVVSPQRNVPLRQWSRFNHW